MNTLSIMVARGTPAERALRESGIEPTYGDTKIVWDADKQGDVGVARELFEKLTREGYLAFRVLGQDKQGERIEKFDREAERLILIPAIAGG